jgi:hypothetical protein
VRTLNPENVSSIPLAVLKPLMKLLSVISEDSEVGELLIIFCTRKVLRKRFGYRLIDQ